MDNILEQSKEERVREQNRIRAKKFYDLNREKIKETKKQSYEAKKETIVPVNKYSNDELKRMLGELELNPNTKRKYTYDLKRLYELINNEPLMPLIRDANSLINIINESTFATTTQRGLIQICLFMITKFELNVNKQAREALTHQFELLKLKNDEEHAKKVETESVLSWREYLKRVTDSYGVGSKMYLISHLYHQLTLRDDFQLKIVERKPKDTDANYIVLNKNNYTVIINQYKTDAKYGQLVVKLTIGLTRLLGKYMAENDIKVGEYLFGNQELSEYVIRYNKKIGVDGGISNYRRMTVSSVLSTASIEERVKLSAAMAHSPFIQEKYLRRIAEKAV